MTLVIVSVSITSQVLITLLNALLCVYDEGIVYVFVKRNIFVENMYCHGQFLIPFNDLKAK